MNYRKLKSHRRRIDRRISELGREPKSLFNNPELSERMADLYDQAAHEYDSGCRLIFSDRERRLISGLRGAVERIENGAFGKCEGCGSRIPEQRMQANPLAVLCIDCKKKEEKNYPGRNS